MNAIFRSNYKRNVEHSLIHLFMYQNHLEIAWNIFFCFHFLNKVITASFDLENMHSQNFPLTIGRGEGHRGVCTIDLIDFSRNSGVRTA